MGYVESSLWRRDSTGGTLATYGYDERGLRILETLQQFDSGGGSVGPAAVRAIHFNSMNPTGYAQIVEELVPQGGGRHSSVRPVDAIENLADGGMLTVFYRFMMKSKPGPFLVVPMPLY